MSGEMIKVRLTGPAKVGARWLKPGDEPEVTLEEHAALMAAGVLDDGKLPYFPKGSALEFTEGADWDAAVKAEAAKIAGTFFDGELARLEADVKSIMAAAEAEVAEANARATSAEAERDGLKARIVGLEDELKVMRDEKSPVSAGDAGTADGNSSTSPPGGAAAPATTNTPPEKVAKTAPKKGAATTPKG